MCKITALIGFKDNKKALTFAKLAANEMNSYADHHDGFGYMGLTKNKVFGERWLDNDRAFEKDDNEKKYNSFNNIELKNMTSMILHSRLATSAYGLKNVHPFYCSENKLGLIHNGVITNTFDFNLSKNNCDSLCILNSYIKHDVKNSPENIRQVASELSGFYACFIAGVKNNQTYIDVFKCRISSLKISYIKELGLVLSSTDDIIKKCAKKMNLNVVFLNDFKDDTLIRFCPETGEIEHKVEFNSRGYFF